MTSRLSTLAGLALLAFGLSSLPALASSALIVKPVHALAVPAPPSPQCSTWAPTARSAFSGAAP